MKGSVSIFRDQFEDMRLVGAEYSPVGRFLGYRPEFLEWFSLIANMVEDFGPGIQSKRSIGRARDLIGLEMDGGFFGEACEQIRQAIDYFEVETEETAFEISKELFQEFAAACEGVSELPPERAEKLIRDDTKVLVQLANDSVKKDEATPRVGGESSG